MSASPSLDLERLFNEHQRDLLAMLRRMVGCQETAADLAQEAYARLAHVPASQTIMSPRAFLFRTATNLALDHFRKQKFRGQRQASLDEAEQIPTEAPSADTQVYDKQRVVALETALAELSERTRSVFVCDGCTDIRRSPRGSACPNGRWKNTWLRRWLTANRPVTTRRRQPSPPKGAPDPMTRL